MTEFEWSIISTIESQIESLREENTEFRSRIEALEESLADSDEAIRRIIEDLLTSVIPSDGVWNELSPFSQIETIETLRRKN